MMWRWEPISLPSGRASARMQNGKAVRIEAEQAFKVGDEFKLERGERFVVSSAKAVGTRWEGEVEPWPWKPPIKKEVPDNAEPGQGRSGIEAKKKDVHAMRRDGEIVSMDK